VMKRSRAQCDVMDNARTSGQGNRGAQFVRLARRERLQDKKKEFLKKKSFSKENY